MISQILNKSLFRILNKRIDNPEMVKIPTMVLACAILHNIHLTLYADFSDFEEENLDHLRFKLLRNRRYRQEYKHAKMIRQTLVHYLHSLPETDRGTH